MDIVLCSWMLLIHSIYNSLHLPVNQGNLFWWWWPPHFYQNIQRGWDMRCNLPFFFCYQVASLNHETVSKWTSWRWNLKVQLKLEVHLGRARFLHQGDIDILDRVVLCCRGGLANRKRFSSISGLHLLDASKMAPATVVTTKNVSRYWHMSPGEKMPPAENHCVRGTTKRLGG